MKHLYIDVSSLKKSERSVFFNKIYPLISQCRENFIVKYVMCDMESGVFFDLDNDVETKLSDLEVGAIYFDIVSSSKVFPPRNYLYKLLKGYGLRIVPFLMLDKFDFLLTSRDYVENNVMLALDCISSAVDYASFIIFENRKAAANFNRLCNEMNVSCPEYDIISSKTIFNSFCKISKEAGSVYSDELIQMVVLTARNDDIMKSLPFVEAFMPFIKELVVCCPPQNVRPFKEQYNGRLSLVFITDDELLNGAKLPSDHQARNFFLRCKLMEQDAVDDLFIMTDDDYRPIKPITKEFFIKDGRYQSYYFYDIKEWQGTYNNYTSFDMGAFKTRDFLIENKYPTLQYSSHQPQIIDKRIFKEMLKVHKGIENNPYDEWSTYFNYGFAAHPDAFKPCKSVSMCWPGDLASWDIYHIPEEYFFENYYEELYKEGQMFENFSETYNENTENENIEKARIYRERAFRQLKERYVFNEYQKEYEKKMGNQPSFVISFNRKKTGKARLTVPKYIKLAVDSWTRIPIAVQKSLYNDSDIFISYHFINSLGVPVLNSPEIPLKSGDRKIALPVRSPSTAIKNAVLQIRVTLRKKAEDSCPNDGAEMEAAKHLSFENIKNIKLMLIKINEVDYV